ncbi:uncharacterized protein TNCV_2957401 [Trichonephila clavipes]|nr:uncharacterized protein TNCV_2957401 [Trichonephila clavipes]
MANLPPLFPTSLGVDPRSLHRIKLLVGSVLEIFFRTKHQNKTAWIVLPPEHHWYQCSRPGGSEAHGFKRQDQTLLARFRNGHLKTMKFSEGFKSFDICTNCSSVPASPDHILECLGLTKKDLADDPLLVLDFFECTNTWTWSNTAGQWGVQ